MATDDDRFLSRWARRKEQARTGQAPAPVAMPQAEPPVTPAALPEPNAALAELEPAPPEPLPTMADVALLTRESDYSRFVAPGIDVSVERAAMKKLFADPHFNVMDGLDTYIDDYGKPDPIPLSMLRRMNQSKILRLFDDEDEQKEQAAPTMSPATAATEAPSDDDPDLRLQQDDAAGRPGPDQGAGA